MIIPAASTFRIRSLRASAMKRLPAPSTATPLGKSSRAAVAGPPSPPNPDSPEPATVVIIPAASTFRIRSLRVSAMKRLPAPSSATPLGKIQQSRGCRTPVPAEPAHFRARHGRDHPRRVHLPDPVVARVGDEEIASAVHRHAAGEIQQSRGCRTPVPAEPGLSRARHGRDHPRRVHLPDPVVARVGDEEVAGAVQRHAAGENPAEPRLPDPRPRRTRALPSPPRS